MPFIYTLIDPITNEIRYVGKANNPERRLEAHIYGSLESSNPHKHRWIKKLRKSGLKPILHVIEICADSEWKQREIYWTAKYRKANHKLLNISKGGAAGDMSPEGRDRQHAAYITNFAKRRGIRLYKCFSCGCPTVSHARLCKKCGIELSESGHAEAVKFYINSYRDEIRKNRTEDKRCEYTPNMDRLEGRATDIGQFLNSETHIKTPYKKPQKNVLKG